MRDSKDDKVRAAGVEVKTWRKWSASKAVTEAESRLKHRDIVGTEAVGRQGLGTSKGKYTRETKHVRYIERSNAEKKKPDRQKQ